MVRAAKLGVLPAHIAAALPGVHKSTVGRILDRHGSTAVEPHRPVRLDGR